MLAGVLCVYVAYAVAMILVHPQLIYPFGADRFEAEGWQTQIVSPRDVTLAVTTGDDDVAVLFFMGNGGSLAYFTWSLEVHKNAGRAVAAMQYRGGGGVEGTPSEAQLKADALAAFDWLAVQHDGPIVVHGFSLGTGLAIHVAANRDVAAVVLDAPYTRMCALMAQASYLPACYLPFVQKWNTGAYADQISVPVLIQHGSFDKLIPLREGLRLAAVLEGVGVRVTTHIIDGATHNNLAGQPAYGARINRFFAACDDPVKDGSCVSFKTQQGHPKAALLSKN